MSEKYLVTGASGFVGSAIARKLKTLGHDVSGVARRECPDLEALGIRIHKLDLTESLEPLRKDISSVDGVFHTAAKVGMWGEYDDFYRSNVVATKNLIELALSCGVKRFVYTSSPSVIADGSNLRGVDESYPYPDSHSANYPKTKAEAERFVLDVNGEIKTLSLRPHLIFGPGDHNLVPLIVNRAKQGRLFRIGAGNNITDVCYIDDCVNAHILGMESLHKNPEASGKAYFITQGEPVPLWEWIDEILIRNGIPKLSKTVPKWAANTIAVCSEAFSRIFSKEPLLTKFLVCEMTTDHYFNISRAKSLLKFSPEKSVIDALNLTFGVPK